MSSFYFIFVLVASYSLCVSGELSEECWKREDSCDGSLFPDTFPKTVNELRDACRDIKLLANCILKVYDSCPDDPGDIQTIEEFRRITEYVHVACREESEVFQAIARNLQCLASNVNNIFGSCNDEFSYSEPIEKLIGNLRQHAEEMDASEGDFWCLDILWDAKCPSAKAGVICGPEAGAAVEDILLQGREVGLCSDEFVAEVSSMLELLELAIVEEENLKKMKVEEEEEEKGTSAEKSRRKRRFASPFQAFRDKILLK